MGHHEDLLEGAKRCLLEKGWVGTTARDIVSASGANLASIGYHYGSKEALLMAAFLDLTGEGGDEVGRRLRTDGPRDTDRTRRITTVLDAMTASFSENRQFWHVQMEVIGQLGHLPQLRRKLAEAQPPGREGILAMFEDAPEGSFDAETVRTAGSFYHALFIGLWIQWLIDPDTGPSGREVAEGMRRVMTGALTPAEPAGSAVKDEVRSPGSP
jgi:AcrR family transcriptional regulator